VRYKLASCSGVPPWRRSPWCGGLALAVVLWWGGPAALADAPPRQLSVLNAAVAGVGAAQSASVDQALHEALAEHLKGSKLETSPVPFEDVQLIAGCGSDEPTCLQLIAEQLGSDALLVRRLDAQPDGSALLVLTAYATRPDAPPSPPRLASTRIDWTQPGAAQGAVQQLLVQLQLQPPPAPAPVVLAPADDTALDTTQEQPASTAPASPMRWQRRLGWTLSAVGCSLLAAGLITGAAARRNEEAYANVVIDGPKAVDEAHAALDDAERQAAIANGLFIAGAVTATAGLATVLWRWAALRKDARATLGSRAQEPRAATLGARSERPRTEAVLSLLPTRAGLMLSISGSWQGGS